MPILKNILLTSLLLSSLICFASTDKTYRVIKVIDGDTVYIDFNKDGFPQKEEKVRLNGIDTFEVKPSKFLEYQMKSMNLSQEEALGLGYLGKEFAKKHLLNKYVRVEYTGDKKFCDVGRHLMSVWYDNGKNYEQEVLKAGLGVVYRDSNIADELYQYEDMNKIKKNAQKSSSLNLVLLNKKNGKYHKPTCEYGLMSSDVELIKKPFLKYHGAGCCFDVKKKRKIHSTASFSSDSIEIYFLDPTVDYDNIENAALNRLLNLIYSAKRRIYFAIYGISENNVIDALIKRYIEKIDIKWITDVNKYGNNNYSRTAFLQNKIPVFKTDITNEELKFRSKQNVTFYIKNQEINATFNDSEIQYFTDQLMHNKFFIFDEDIVTTGSANISTSGIGGSLNTNANDFIVINSSEINKIYSQEFIQMYRGQFHRSKSKIEGKKNLRLFDGSLISIYFAPIDKDFMADVSNIINSSQKFVYVPMFYLTNESLAQSLINAKERGVDVRVILDASSAMSKYSKHKILRIANIPVKIENWRGKMHMKCLITERYVVTGSLNWTSRGQYFNDENSLIIENPQISEVYKNHFLSLYNQIPDKWLWKDPKPEGKDTPGSCSDGIDNDHDGFTDMGDYDCNPHALQGKPYEDYYEKQK